MAPSALIFDLDGTLIDTERHNLKAWTEAGRQLGYTLELDFYRSLIGRRAEDTDRRLLQRFGAECPVPEWRALRRQLFYQWWDEGHGPGWKPGLEKLLEHSPLPRAVATSSLEVEARDKIRRSRLQDHFPHLVAGDQVERGKPAPDLFLKAAELLGMPARHCLVVEDSPLGMEAAEAAGMQAVFIVDLVAPRPGDRVLASLAQLVERIP